MRNEQVLGFYSFGGTVYVNLDIAENPTRMSATINHESTHLIVSYTTTWGFVQEVLRTGRESQFVSAERRAVAAALEELLFRSSRLAHEATATYAGLVDYAGPDLREQIAHLPPLYRRAYQIFDELLGNRGWEPLERYRVARAIGARAFQTSLFDRWIPDELWRETNLVTHLADPQNRPDDRLDLLVGVLRLMPDDELRAWCGRHLRGDSSFLLSPPVPAPIAGLQFDPLPPLARAQARAREIAATVYPGHDDTLGLQTIGHGGRPEIALAPPGFASLSVASEHPGPDDLAWAREADFAMLIRNPFEEQYGFDTPLGGQQVRPNTATIYLFRPDYPAARRYAVPNAAMGDFLDLVDPDRRLTVCLTGNWSWLPDSPGAGRSGVPLHDQMKGRPVLIYTGGGSFGFTMSCTMLEQIGAPVQIHRMQTGLTWGLILLRSPRAAGLSVIHPIVLAEWNRVGEVAYEQCDLERDTAPEVFFPHGPVDVLPALTFFRVYKGLTMPERRWRELADAMARDEARAPHVNVDPVFRGTEWDNAG